MELAPCLSEGVYALNYIDGYEWNICCNFVDKIWEGGGIQINQRRWDTAL